MDTSELCLRSWLSRGTIGIIEAPHHVRQSRFHSLTSLSGLLVVSMAGMERFKRIVVIDVVLDGTWATWEGIEVVFCEGKARALGGTGIGN